MTADIRERIADVALRLAKESTYRHRAAEDLLAILADIPVHQVEPCGALSDAASEAIRWRHIETAPMDGTKFLGLRDGIAATACRIPRDDCEMWQFGNQSAAVEHFPNIKPTHWMPLPPPPSSASVGGTGSGT